jgi:L-malate glycosyltransferase
VKIVHFLASPFFTGPAEAVTQLALAQRALGHHVEVAIDRKRHSTTSEELLAPRLEALGLLSALPLELSVKSTPWAMLRDVVNLRKLEVDVAHSHVSHDHTLLRLGCPPGTTVVRSLHAPRSWRRSTPRAAGYTVCMEALTPQLAGHRVMALPAMVGPEFSPAPDRDALRARLGLAEGWLIGMVSTFQASRRHALGLQAFAALAAARVDARFILVGDGGLEPRLREKAAPLGSAVHFAGYRSGAEFVQHLQALDEVWVLGLGNDFSGRAAAQARACGVRVLTVDEGDLGRYADVVVEPDVTSIVRASLGGAWQAVTLESCEAIARRVVAFYGRG